MFIVLPLLYQASHHLKLKLNLGENALFLNENSRGFEEGPMTLQYIEWTNIFPDDEVKSKMLLFPLKCRRNPQEKTELARLRTCLVVYLFCIENSPGAGSNTSVVFWTCPEWPPGFREALNMDTAPRSHALDTEEARFHLTATPFKPQPRVWVSSSWLERQPNRARVSRLGHYRSLRK